MDGYASGAICKLRYPDARLIGWDYKDPIPDFEQFRGEEVIMIDITFPLNKIIELSAKVSHLTIIDHHISFAKDFHTDILNSTYSETLKTITVVRPKLKYVYELGVAACEIGWKYLFPYKTIPYAISLIGRYDTWRKDEGDWQGETLPFKYYMYGQCNSVESFPKELLIIGSTNLNAINHSILTGRSIMKYQEMMDESATRAFSFDKEVYNGLRALVLNIPYFNSESLKTKYNKEDYDIMIGFCYTGNKWSVSLRSDKPEVDVSIIAKNKGGGGHKGAAGFEVENFEDIFK